MDYFADSDEDSPPLVEELHVAISTTSSSQEVSLESVEWIPEDSPKMKLFKQGLYDPGPGEICAEYVFVSSSSLQEHLYYCYPGVTDPGIVEAILRPEKQKIYPDDGQELYLDLCDEMKIMPVGIFYRGLRDKQIDLKYYGVNPSGVRAMCMALVNNRTVKRLDLTGNYLEGPDACYHLGQMLGDRNALQSLVLSCCKISPEGVRRLVVYLSRRQMTLLDLSWNDLRDLGLSYLAEAIEQGAVIKQLNLSRNDLSSASAFILADALGVNNCVTHLDLSWNKFTRVRGQVALCRRLGHSNVLVKLDLSWTGLNITLELRNLLGIKNLKILNLSYNRLSTVAAKIIAKSLHLAKKLQVLDLSSNPFLPGDALLLLEKMRHENVKIQELLMNHVVVSKEFYDELQAILALDFRKNTKITHGTVLCNYSIKLHDLRTITVQSLIHTTKKKKKSRKPDAVDFIIDFQKRHNSVEPGEFIKILQAKELHIHDEIINGLVDLFPGPKNDNGWKTLSLKALVEYIYRLLPHKMPPLSPPTSPTPPEPISPMAGKKSPIQGK